MHLAPKNRTFWNFKTKPYPNFVVSKSGVCVLVVGLLVMKFRDQKFSNAKIRSTGTRLLDYKTDETSVLSTHQMLMTNVFLARRQKGLGMDIGTHRPEDRGFWRMLVCRTSER